MMRYTMLTFGCALLLILHPPEAQALYALESETLESSGFAWIFPESTLAVMVVPHLHATSERFQHYYSSTLALITSLQPLVHSISHRLQEFEDFSGIHLAELGLMFQASFAIALLDVDTSETPQIASFPFPGVLLAADVTNSAETLHDLLERVIRHHILLRAPSVEFQTKIVQGVTLWSVSNSQFQFAYTFLDHLFLLTTHPEYLEQAIARRQHPVHEESLGTSKPLYNTKVYQTATIAQADYDVRLYVNIQQIWQKWQRGCQKHCLPPSVPETLWDTLLCNPPALRSLSWFFSLKENGGHERIFWEIDCQEDHRTSSGWARWPCLRTMENDHLISDQFVPGNILYYRAWQFDSFVWWQRWKHCIDTVLSVNDRENAAFQIQKLEQALQRRVESDILPAFGNEIAIACYNPSRWIYVREQEGSLENFPCFLILRLEQREQIEHLLRSIAAIPVSNIIVQGMPVYQLDVPGKITSLTLYAAVIHDFLAITSSQRGLQQIIAVTQQGGSLASLPEYAGLSALFAKACYTKSYFNLRYFLQHSNFFPTSAAEKSMARPSFLSGFLSVTTNISSGMLTESFSPIGGTVIGTGIILWYVLSVRS